MQSPRLCLGLEVQCKPVLIEDIERERVRMGGGGASDIQVESIVSVATSPLYGRSGYRIAKVTLYIEEGL